MGTGRRLQRRTLEVTVTVQTGMVEPMLDAADVADRIDNLRRINEVTHADRLRIRKIMDGGAGAIEALLGDNVHLKNDDLPAANMMDSGLTRLAQRLGQAPDVKVDPRVDRDSKRERTRVAKRQRIVAGYDYHSKLEMQLPQAGRSLPGYGFAVRTLR